MRPLWIPALVLLTAGGCQAPGAPRAVTAADSLAVAIADAHGGLAAFAALPALRFDFVVTRDSATSTRRHLWEPAADRARVEWTTGDSSYVAVFAPSAPASGMAALDGQPLAGEALAAALDEAHGAHINDAYWLLAPLKTMDPGVRRQLVRDSLGTALGLSFDGVGLTPGDRYRIAFDPATHAVTGWRYVLESGSEGDWAWSGAQNVETPRGTLTLPLRKVNRASGAVIETPVRPVPNRADVWTSLAPRLGAPDEVTP